MTSYTEYLTMSDQAFDDALLSILKRGFQDLDDQDAFNRAQRDRQRCLRAIDGSVVCLVPAGVNDLSLQAYNTLVLESARLGRPLTDDEAQMIVMRDVARRYSIAQLGDLEMPTRSGV